jgi:signal transduction histidine kinase
MLQRMGGTISVRSRVGQGSVFSFTMPLFQEQDAPVVNKPYTGPERRQSSVNDDRDERRGSWRITQYLKNIGPKIDNDNLEEKIRAMVGESLKGRPTILICEDTLGQLHLLVEALHLDYNLLIASDGKQGLEKARNYHGRLDLVISDVRMPNMDGIKFCEAFFSDESRRLIPFIFLTAYANEHEQLKGLSFGATDYIQKPFNRPILLEKINHWLTRRNHEMLLEQMITDLEKKNEMISRFRSIITHEIRNPLAVLSGSDYYLKSLHGVIYDKLDEKLKKQWNHVEKTVALAQDINNILENARIMEQSVTGSSCRPVPFEEVLSVVMDYNRLLTDDTRVVIDGAIPEIGMVLCDISMVRQIMANLICNSIEAVRDSGRAGSVTCKAQTDNHNLLLSIIDTGVGMTDEQRQNLFKYRVTTKKDGNGIGLYLCYKLLQLQNGNIACTSKPGEGTTFTVQLPLAEKIREDEVVPLSPSICSGGISEQPK